VAVDARAAELSRAVRRTEREMERTPKTLDVPGEKVPWTWVHAFQIPVALALSGFFLWLGWCSVRFIVANSGILPADQSWIVSGVGVAIVGALEFVAICLHTHEQRVGYLKALLTAGIATGAVWIAGVAYVYGRAVFQSPQLGSEAPSDAPLIVGVVQLGLQYASEILCSAGFLVAVHVICEKHAGLRTAVHDEWRRRARLLSRLGKALSRVQLVQAALRARLRQSDAARDASVAEAVRAYETHLRRLKTEVADLVSESRHYARQDGGPGGPGAGTSGMPAAPAGVACEG
jgi:hypothetical protein